MEKSIKKLKIIEKKIEDNFEISNDKIEKIIRLYDKPKPTKKYDEIYCKLCKIACKYDDYEMQFYEIVGRFGDLYECVELENKISYNAINKAKTNKKILSLFLDKVNKNVEKLRKICIEENLDVNDYASNLFLNNIDPLKKEYNETIDNIIKEYERGDL